MITALYRRVSTREQAEEGYSIDEQLVRLTKYAESMGWDQVKDYCDAGFSGSNINRPGLQALIQDAEAGRLERVIVWKLDRLSRSQKDTLHLIEDIFMRHGVQFVSMLEAFDTSNSFGRAMIGILSVFAQLEREQITERLIMGKAARAKAGKFCGGRVIPIGYQYINGELIPDPYEAQQVRLVFEKYINGGTVMGIADEMNEAGYTHKYAGRWSWSTVSAMLKRRTYIGEVFFQGTWYPGTHEPIIDRETWDKAQQVVASRRHHAGLDNANAHKTSLLAGFLRCAECGRPYYIHSHTAKGKHGQVYYTRRYECQGRFPRRSIDKTDCRNLGWRDFKLEALVFDEIKKLAADPAYLAKIEAARPERDNREDDLQEALEKIDGQISRLVQLYSLDGISYETIAAKVEDATKKKAKICADLDRIREKNQNQDDQVSNLLSMDFAEIIDRGDTAEIRQLLCALIDHIDLKDKQISIFWKFN